MRKRESWIRKYTPIMGAAAAEEFYLKHQREAAQASVIARWRRKYGL